MNKYRADIVVTLKKGVRDPQGAAIDTILKRTGMEDQAQAQVGKFFNLIVSGQDEADAKQKLNKICEDVLSNPVLEKYEIARFTQV